MDNNSKLPIKDLIREKRYWHWSLALQFIRAPMIMTSLAFVVISNYLTGTSSIGGIMITAYVLSMTLFTIPCGRLIDKVGLHLGIPFSLKISSIALLGILWVTVYEFPDYWLIILSALSGGSIAGVPGAMRSLLASTVSAEKLPAAVALDATMIELVVVISPLIAALSSIWWEPGAMLSMVVLNVCAGILTKRLTQQISKTTTIPMPKVASDQYKKWYKNRRFLFWVIVSVSFGHMLGSAEVGALPLVKQFGKGTGEAAILLSALAFCSAASGIIYAMVFHKINVSYPKQAILFVLTLILSCLYLGFCSSFFHSLLAVSFIGLSVAPLMTVRSIAVEREIPIEHKTEGFSIINTSHTIGFALGGLLLSILPLFWMFITAVISGTITIITAFFLGINRINSPDNERHTTHKLN